VRASGPRPAGADNYLRWRRTIDEHLELRRISMLEYAMFSWLCTKADPRTGLVRTNWLTLAQQTGLTANHIEKLCRSLRHKGYVSYPIHRGTRRVLVELAIDKFPLADGSYTTLRSRRDGRGAEVPAEARAELLAEVLAEVPAELDGKTPAISRASLGGRSRERNRKRNRSSLRVRSADADPVEQYFSQDLEVAPELQRSRADALAQAPAILRETLELFFLKTGRAGLGADESSALRDLERAHTPAVIQRAISAAVARFIGRGQSPMALTLLYVRDSLKHFTTRKTGPVATDAVPPRKYPDGVTRLYLTEDTYGRDPIPQGPEDSDPRGARGEARSAP
jgi:hypothetical protein